jgi:hypothetical protein
MNKNLLEHLKAVIEGVPNLPRWRDWFVANETELAKSLSRGELLRLRYYPIKEIPKVLAASGLEFRTSEYYEWLDGDSESGRCHDCGAQLQHAIAGDRWTWCPNGCFQMEAHQPPPRIH